VKNDAKYPPTVQHHLSWHTSDKHTQQQTAHYSIMTVLLQIILADHITLRHFKLTGASHITWWSIESSFTLRLHTHVTLTHLECSLHTQYLYNLNQYQQFVQKHGKPLIYCIFLTIWCDMIACSTTKKYALQWKSKANAHLIFSLHDVLDLTPDTRHDWLINWLTDDTVV